MFPILRERTLENNWLQNQLLWTSVLIYVHFQSSSLGKPTQQNIFVFGENRSTFFDQLSIHGICITSSSSTVLTMSACQFEAWWLWMLLDCGITPRFDVKSTLAKQKHYPGSLSRLCHSSALEQYTLLMLFVHLYVQSSQRKTVCCVLTVLNQQDAVVNRFGFPCYCKWNASSPEFQHHVCQTQMQVWMELHCRLLLSYVGRKH